MKQEEIISDEKIASVFKNTNFGDSNPRDVVKETLLELVCGFKSGHTATSIISELGLLTTRGFLTQKGKKYFWACYGRP